MNSKIVLLGTAALLLGAHVAFGQDTGGDEAESTIRLMGAAEASLPDAVTKEISLPRKALGEDSEAVANAAQEGLDNANQNRLRREDGLTNADEAREQGAQMADEAQDNRESQGRSDDRPDPPTRPGPPDN